MKPPNITTIYPFGKMSSINHIFNLGQIRLLTVKLQKMMLLQFGELVTLDPYQAGTGDLLFNKKNCFHLMFSCSNGVLDSSKKHHKSGFLIALYCVDALL